eukprot:g4393.t1
MSKRKNSSSESSSSSNKKRHVNDDTILTDARYEELYERYCKPWDQLNAESGGGTLKEFKDKYGKHKWPSRNYKHTIIYNDGKEETINLGEWCKSQRQAKKGNRDSNLTKEQIRRLNNIGFIWDRRVEQQIRYHMAANTEENKKEEEEVVGDDSDSKK